MGKGFCNLSIYEVVRSCWCIHLTHRFKTNSMSPKAANEETTDRCRAYDARWQHFGMVEFLHRCLSVVIKNF